MRRRPASWWPQGTPMRLLPRCTVCCLLPLRGTGWEPRLAVTPSALSTWGEWANALNLCFVTSRTANSERALRMTITHLPGGNGVSGRQTVLVAGGGGFIGGHLTRTLSERGVHVRSVDIKPLEDWYQIPDGVEALQLDLSAIADCHEAVHGVDTVYNLAADMGGM